MWSFQTYQGLVIDLNAAELAEGKLRKWSNHGRGGDFVAGKRGDLRVPLVKSFKGVTGIGLQEGKVLQSSFPAPSALESGPFSVYMRFAEPIREAFGIVAGWGTEQDKADLMFGTAGRGGHPALKWGPKGSEEVIEWDRQSLMAYFWKTAVLTYDRETMRLYVDGKLIAEKKTDFEVKPAGRLHISDAERKTMNGLLGELKVFSRALTPQEIKRLVSGERVAAKETLVSISTADLEEGCALGRLENTGSLGGYFGVPEDIDRSPTVKTVAGRKCVWFDGQQTFMQSDAVTPPNLTGDHPFTVEITAYSQDADGKGSIMSLAPQVQDLQFRHLTLGRSASLSFGGTNDGPLAFLNDFEHNRRSNTAECDVFWKTDGNNTDRWAHLAWVYEGGRRSKLKLYLDGKPNNEKGYFTLATVQGYLMRLGSWFNTAAGEKSMFKGGIGSVRVYDYARTAEEIAAAAR